MAHSVIWLNYGVSYTVSPLQDTPWSNLRVQLIVHSLSLCASMRAEMSTRNLSYRKDDCAMRLIYGCSENFREFLTTPTATIPEMFNWLLFRSMLLMCV